MSLTQRLYQREELDHDAASRDVVAGLRLRKLRISPAARWSMAISALAHFIFVFALGPHSGASPLPYEPNVLRYDHLPAVAFGEIEEGWLDAGGNATEAAPAAIDAPESEAPPQTTPVERETAAPREETPEETPEVAAAEQREVVEEQPEQDAQLEDTLASEHGEIAPVEVEDETADEDPSPRNGELPDESELAAADTGARSDAVAPGAIRSEDANGRGGSDPEAEQASASGRGDAAPGVAVGDPDGDLDGLRREHRDRLSRAISSQNICTREMLREGLRGVVELGLQQDAEGELVRIRVLRSRGGEAAEDAALAYVRGLRRLPRPDARITGDEFRLPVIINCAR